MEAKGPNIINSLLGKEQMYIRFLIKQYGTIDDSLKIIAKDQTTINPCNYSFS